MRMEMMNNYGVFSILAVGLGLIARHCLARLWNEAQPGMRLGLMAGLFMVYTAGLLLTLRQVYCCMPDTGGSLQSYHHMALMAIFAVNIIVLFVGIFYYFIRGKRRLSGADKMKLMDL